LEVLETAVADVIGLSRRDRFDCLGRLAGDAETDLREALGPPRVALVLGAEGAGLRPNTREHCDAVARLPIGEAIESLNVSNAAAVALYAASIA